MFVDRVQAVLAIGDSVDAVPGTCQDLRQLVTNDRVILDDCHAGSDERLPCSVSQRCFPLALLRDDRSGRSIAPWAPCGAMPPDGITRTMAPGHHDGGMDAASRHGHARVAGDPGLDDAAGRAGTPPPRRPRTTTPPGISGYHSYPEMVQALKAAEAAHPDIVRVFSIGTSYQGRTIWAAEVSDDVGTDEGEPEVMFDGLHHAREHLSGEMPLYILRLLTGNYGKDTALGRRVTRIVDTRRIWIIPMVNPDGLEYDLGGHPYRGWRKNRQPNPGSSSVGTDLNRNYDYAWQGAPSNPASINYRGSAPFSAPETQAIRDFVLSRRVDGVQRIRTHISFHTAGEYVLWPYGHTHTAIPPDMTRLDALAFRRMGRHMAATNGYRPEQSSAMYQTYGDEIDWLYGTQRIFSYTFEMYPTTADTSPSRHYPPDELIGRETRRNREAVLYLMEHAACPYRALGRAASYCGPLYDDLEVARGWTTDPDGTDTATSGTWQRGDPVAVCLAARLGDLRPLRPGDRADTRRGCRRRPNHHPVPVHPPAIEQGGHAAAPVLGRHVRRCHRSRPLPRPAVRPSDGQTWLWP